MKTYVIVGDGGWRVKWREKGGSGCSSDMGEACEDSTQMKIPCHPATHCCAPLAFANPEGTAKATLEKTSHI